ncbi:MAG: hypothetical protein ACRYGF_00695 [Janthinobacterium lividum]
MLTIRNEQLVALQKSSRAAFLRSLEQSVRTRRPEWAIQQVDGFAQWLVAAAAGYGLAAARDLQHFADLMLTEEIMAGEELDTRWFHGRLTDIRISAGPERLRAALVESNRRKELLAYNARVCLPVPPALPDWIP